MMRASDRLMAVLIGPTFRLKEQPGKSIRGRLNKKNRKVLKDIANIRTAHPKLPIIIGGDGLYSKQPFIDELKTANMSFIIVVKPLDHKILFEWVHEMIGLQAGSHLTITDNKGRKHQYLWVHDVPLNGSKDADHVNFFDYRIIIENEIFNTLKNQGYHLEHNFGHGHHNLSIIFFMINLPAFYVHQILDFTDSLYQKVRYTKFTSRKEFWNQLRCTIRILIFHHWQSLMQFIWDPEKGIPP